MLQRINKKGQSFGLTLIGVIGFLIIGFMCVNFFFNEVTNTRALLSCSSPSTISDATKLLCLVVDLTIPIWIWVVLAVGLGYILARFLL